MSKSLNEQVKAIRLAMIKDYMETCEDCGLTGHFPYRREGYLLCPHCHESTIENFKKKQLQREV